MKKILKAVGIILALLVIYYAAQSLVTIVIAIVPLVRTVVSAASSNMALDVEGITNELLRFVGAQTPWVLLIAVAVTVPFYYLIYRGRRQELWTFVSLKAIHPVSVPVLVVFGLTLNFMIELLLGLLSQISGLRQIFENYNQVTDLIFNGSFVLTLLAVGIVGPIFEELLFRGLVFGELRKLTKVRVAIFIQALLFGVYHMNLIQGAYAFLIGILLGYVYYRSNSIFAPMLVHITVNSSSVLLSEFLSGGALEKWSGVIIIASVLLFIVTGAFILTHRSFRYAMDDSLYLQNHTPRLQEPPGYGGES
ncbi:hypothetical protein SAMN02745823_02132 [Sporobacter termitidis DSM 10068]|uniref:CAAX prenyl protease 2/Lysostaphin resistance protein A-like domain-containing protein n=1 Tax=Sporobacter termitidis DSM 10068 TaxID=1123282 RepID=A0A1M5Y0Y1_9FIRM|nr:type II CAAX endopeptidase family protein [Sporobacter termitidis]SHI05725.1 hypothetical protein SAMN02745823_02132 [Sporobacter termitidis DSM 10068]